MLIQKYNVLFGVPSPPAACDPNRITISNTSYKRRRFRVTSSKESWDFGRFLSTVLYFNPPPTLENAAQFLTNTFFSSRGEQDSRGTDGWILVTGATGAVGRRVVAKLLKEGYRVRALVQSAEKARQLQEVLPRTDNSVLDIVVVDICQPQTLQSQFFQDVNSVILAAATTAAPRVGDAEDHARNMQGVNVDDAEIVGTLPEAVEYQELQKILRAVKPSLQRAHYFEIFGANGKSVEWGSLDDVVMGGASQSAFQLSQSGQEACFSGRVTAANNGGFASVRTRNFSPPLNLSRFDCLALCVQGSGLRYKVSLRTDPGWDGIGYTQSFDTRPGEWQTVLLPFSGFIPIFRAKRKLDAEPFNPSNVVSIQLMLSKFEYDGALNPNFSEGEFSLLIAGIGATCASAGPRVIHVSSAGVTRHSRAGLDLEEEPPAVRMLEDLLAGEDAVRQSTLPYTIVRPVTLTDELRGAELEIDQGDTMKGKIAREDIADLCVALVGETAALNCTFEIRSTETFTESVQAHPSQAKREWPNLLKSANLNPDSALDQAGLVEKNLPA